MLFWVLYVTSCPPSCAPRESRRLPIKIVLPPFGGFMSRASPGRLSGNFHHRIYQAENNHSGNNWKVEAREVTGESSHWRAEKERREVAVSLHTPGISSEWTAKICHVTDLTANLRDWKFYDDAHQDSIRAYQRNAAIARRVQDLDIAHRVWRSMRARLFAPYFKIEICPIEIYLQKNKRVKGTGICSLTRWFELFFSFLMSPLFREEKTLMDFLNKGSKARSLPDRHFPRQLADYPITSERNGERSRATKRQRIPSAYVSRARYNGRSIPPSSGVARGKENDGKD